MPEFDLDKALRGDSVWAHQQEDPWGLCQFFKAANFKHVAISRWVSRQRAGLDTILLGLVVPDDVPWSNDTPAEQIDAYADWVEVEARRLVDKSGVEVTGWELYVGTTDSDIAIYFDIPEEAGYA